MEKQVETVMLGLYRVFMYSEVRVQELNDLGFRVLGFGI